MIPAAAWPAAFAVPGPPDALACAVALLAALGWDRWAGEPPARWHPVVWMGRALAACERLLPSAARANGWHFTAGALAWCGLAALVSIAAVAVQALLWRALPAPLAALALGLALKPMLAWRMLHDEVAAVEAGLSRSLDEGRARLARLVSRDVHALDAVQVRESAIESLAENLNDSVVAPLFWFLLLGLPGAALYRFANTADAMWGYRTVRRGRDWEWAGKWAARADDALSWLPARIAAALLMAAGRCGRWRALRAESRRTPSPNGGWPMGAMALALGVRLSKPGAYALHPGGRPAAPADAARALECASKAVRAGVALALAALLSIAAWRIASGAGAFA
ncbi:MAG: adenosylcobinamide-phosphate synthase CbiB [Xylophilus ampelinus]